MRTFAFRVWDKQYKIMRYDDIYPKEPYWANSWEASLGVCLMLITRDYELMQYTGILDCDNEKIFEGDIVEMWRYGMPTNMRVKQEVNFINGGFSCGDYPLGLIDKMTLKIIGNIFENSELLK